MQENEEIARELFDLAVESSRVDYKGTLEPFEVYKERMKAQNVPAFCEYLERVQKGYQAIIKKLEALDSRNLK